MFFYARSLKKTLKVTTSVNLNSMGRQKATQTIRRKGRETNIHISSTGPHWGEMHSDAGPPTCKFICINFQCGGPASQCIYSIPKRSADLQIDRHEITKGLRTTGRTYRQTYYTDAKGI